MRTRIAWLHNLPVSVPRDSMIEQDGDAVIVVFNEWRAAVLLPSGTVIEVADEQAHDLASEMLGRRVARVLADRDPETGARLDHRPNASS